MAALVAVSESPLIVVAGPTASGKTALALRLAEHFNGEIVSCDSVAVYRGMDIGSAKPSAAERARIPHHLLDAFDPDQPCTAGDYSRLARGALAAITARGRLPTVTGGTGLYLRALLDGLFPAPPRRDDLRDRLRSTAKKKGSAYLHRLLARLDPVAAQAIHPNDAPKLARALEACLAAKQPLSEQWQQGRNPLTGYRILRLGLNPPRPQLYERINQRAAAMFAHGLIKETTQLVTQYGRNCQPFTSLGYAQALTVIDGTRTRDEAIASAQQGHRNYAKRQLTWFRREPEIHWLPGFGGDEDVWNEAHQSVGAFLSEPTDATKALPPV